VEEEDPFYANPGVYHEPPYYSLEVMDPYTCHQLVDLMRIIFLMRVNFIMKKSCPLQLVYLVVI
jgi:hypothetical protein